LIINNYNHNEFYFQHCPIHFYFNKLYDVYMFNINIETNCLNLFIVKTRNIVETCLKHFHSKKIVKGPSN